MNKSLLVFVMLISFWLSVETSPVEPMAFDDLSRPSFIIAKYDRIYILEKTTVSIYSIKDFKLIKQFGKAGEGPGELKYIPNDRPLNMFFRNGEIVINSQNRVSFFSKDGDYLREVKLAVGSFIYPLKDNYLGVGPILGDDKKSHMGFRLYDQAFKGQKVLFKSDFEVRNPGQVLLPVMPFTYNPLYKDRIYINASSGKFRIQVFDFSGKLVKTISKEYPQLPVSDHYKKESLNFFKTDFRFKGNFDYIKKRLKYRSHHPVIQDIQVAEEKIFVVTYQKKDDLSECIILDMAGKELKRIYVPLNQLEPLSFYPLLYSVYQGKIYSLVEDEEEETWKLHVTDL